MTVCYLGIGSNLGERRRNIKSAVKKVNCLKSTRVLKVSRIIETEPVGGPKGQGKFLNAAMKIETLLTPPGLLKALKKIEKDMGRFKDVRNGPRVIDLDILFYGDKTLNSKQLIIPHPKVFEREFVLRPLAEVI